MRKRRSHLLGKLLVWFVFFEPQFKKELVHGLFDTLSWSLIPIEKVISPKCYEDRCIWKFSQKQLLNLLMGLHNILRTLIDLLL